jgi:hypothetical protein
MEYVDKCIIDKDRVVTPHHARNKKLTYTDHVSINIIFKNIPLKTSDFPTSEKITIWNTNKKGGWDSYKELTSDNKTLIFFSAPCLIS